MTTSFQLNGKPAAFDGDPETPLLWVLRDHLGLTGTKYGCGVAQCGACTVHLDGKNRRSCVTPVGMVAGKTAEAVKAAWVAIDVPQCGFCQSGQVMSAIGLLTAKPRPSDTDIDNAMAGNICR
jgi:isoquinoline 1-oxidoreductase alpha subunit